jgi:hypothetical protein
MNIVLMVLDFNNTLRTSQYYFEVKVIKQITAEFEGKITPKIEL